MHEGFQSFRVSSGVIYRQRIHSTLKLRPRLKNLEELQILLSVCVQPEGDFGRWEDKRPLYQEARKVKEMESCYESKFQQLSGS